MGRDREWERERDGIGNENGSGTVTVCHSLYNLDSETATTASYESLFPALSEVASYIAC